MATLYQIRKTQISDLPRWKPIQSAKVWNKGLNCPVCPEFRYLKFRFILIEFHSIFVVDFIAESCKGSRCSTVLTIGKLVESFSKFETCTFMTWRRVNIQGVSVVNDWRTLVHFGGVTVTLFWNFGDVCPGFSKPEWIASTWRTPHIHLWYNICLPLGSKHGRQASFHPIMFSSSGGTRTYAIVWQKSALTNWTIDTDVPMHIHWSEVIFANNIDYHLLTCTLALMEVFTNNTTLTPLTYLAYLSILCFNLGEIMSCYCDTLVL